MAKAPTPRAALLHAVSSLKTDFNWLELNNHVRDLDYRYFHNDFELKLICLFGYLMNHINLNMQKKMRKDPKYYLQCAEERIRQISTSEAKKIADAIQTCGPFCDSHRLELRTKLLRRTPIPVWNPSSPPPPPPQTCDIAKGVSADANEQIIGAIQSLHGWFNIGKLRKTLVARKTPSSDTTIKTVIKHLRDRERIEVAGKIPRLSYRLIKS